MNRKKGVCKVEGRRIRKHIYFEGRVQGVGFRYKAVYLARELGLTGWVENLWDGRVEMEVQGDERSIGQLLERLGKDRFILIEKITQAQIPVMEERGFREKGY